MANDSATWFILFTADGGYVGPGYTPDGTLPPFAVACDQTTAQASGPWTTLSNGAIVLGTAPPPSPAQLANVALNTGCRVASTATPALNGTYAVDPSAISNIQAEMIAILDLGTFADGTTTLKWPDVAGVLHTLSLDQFKVFAPAIAGFVSACKRMILTNSGTLPAQPVAIP